jgi:hypothetical protein
VAAAATVKVAAVALMASVAAAATVKVAAVAAAAANNWE